jgi:serine/threonine-protein kinase
VAAVQKVGNLVGDRYLLVRMLGEGGMGEVWAATHRVTRAPVALKFLKGVAAARPDLRRRFLREARAATAVRHPNVVRIHDIFETQDGSPVMVMDLLDGESLAARLRRGRLGAAEAAAILLPVVSAIGTAHSVGIVHRDLKPDNVFLVGLVDGRRDVRVLDFGIAKLTASEGDAALTAGITQTGEMLGTPYYMAPEQASGEITIDHRADIWALGVILYECLAGARPIGGANLGQVLTRIITGSIAPLAKLVPEVPADLSALVSSMLSKDRAARPQDLRAVQEVLARHAPVSTPSFEAPRLPLATTPDPRAPNADPLAATGASATPDPLAPTGASATPDPLAPTGPPGKLDPLAPTDAPGTPDPRAQATPDPGSPPPPSTAIDPASAASIATRPFYRGALFRYGAVLAGAVAIAAVTIRLAARDAARSHPAPPPQVVQAPAKAAPVPVAPPAAAPVAPPAAAPAAAPPPAVAPPPARPPAHAAAHRKKHGADPAAAAAPVEKPPEKPPGSERLPGDISAKPTF